MYTINISTERLFDYTIMRKNTLEIVNGKFQREQMRRLASFSSARYWDNKILDNILTGQSLYGLFYILFPFLRNNKLT